jgi:hypothetical protein
MVSQIRTILITREVWSQKNKITFRNSIYIDISTAEKYNMIINKNTFKQEIKEYDWLNSVEG